MIRVILKHMIIVSVIMLALKCGEEAYNLFYGNDPQAVRQSPGAPAGFVLPESGKLRNYARSWSSCCF